MVDLTGQSCFFVKAAIDLAISEAVGLAINATISTRTDIAIGFSELFF